MQFFIVLLKEAWYRKVNSFIILITIIIATAISVAIFSMSKASENETRKIMREQGLNLFLFAKGTNTLDFFTLENIKVFPEKYIDSLARSKTFDAVRHLTGILQVKYSDWQDPNGSIHKIILSGYKDEAEQIYLNKQRTMGFDIPSGKVKIGADISKNIAEGELFVINGKNNQKYEFEIIERMEEGSGIRDQSVAFHLCDLQEILDMEGLISKIEALGCVCHDGRVANARNQLSKLLPDIEVKELSSIANAREYQREMMNKYGSFIIPFVLIGCMFISGLLFYQNIKIRRHEFGIFKATGKNNLEIMLFIIVKAVLFGIIGAITGFLFGSLIANYFGQEVFKFTAKSIKPFWNIFWISLILTPIFSAVVSFIPALIASKIDPAKILNEE